MKLKHIVARHPKLLINVDLYYKSIKEAKERNKSLVDFRYVNVVK